MKRPIHATGDRQLLIRWLHLYLAACFVYPGCKSQLSTSQWHLQPHKRPLTLLIIESSVLSVDFTQDIWQLSAPRACCVRTCLMC
ncbi:hypothetical protein F5878DRAFT_267128 [Lentinula raphanica]|uniref:Uncharacterized protein n=1 Tax=Lentinula raphanica TaxID=153919 RepID=A0AA38UBR7_9AGAR|nr:hypothetical protein F5880DRAFT_833959 [Lentinula raphanica]KAJ3836296.1 hypothetical protein F5878DRAFT_267128 [Lentinula raphanica]